MRKYTPEERISIFWSKVNKSGGPDACWPWQAGCNQDGYGQMSWEGRTDRCHRIAYRLTHGLIPRRLCVCHTCDNPACCNPAHLFLGTHKENMLDRERKGRDSDHRGEKNGRAKVTDEQVAEIRRLYALGGFSQREIGERFGIGRTQVSNIVLGYQRCLT